MQFRPNAQMHGPAGLHEGAMMAEKKKPKTARRAKASEAARKTPVPAKKAKATPAKRAPTRKSPPARRKTAAQRASSPATSSFDLTKLIDHPLVADLLAVGAMAAVAAIADHNVKTRTGETESGSSKAVKAAGKAAAAAIGKRLLTEVDAVRKASKPKDAKRGSR